MGRDPSKKTPKTTRVWVRVEIDRKARWKLAAKAEERSLSTFMILAADARARNPPPVDGPLEIPPPAPVLQLAPIPAPKPRRKKPRRKR
jgi:hypothetical protein